jgi:hypothetical protein
MIELKHRIASEEPTAGPLDATIASKRLTRLLVGAHGNPGTILLLGRKEPVVEYWVQ